MAAIADAGGPSEGMNTIDRSKKSGWRNRPIAALRKRRERATARGYLKFENKTFIAVPDAFVFDTKASLKCKVQKAVREAQAERPSHSLSSASRAACAEGLILCGERNKDIRLQRVRNAAEHVSTKDQIAYGKSLLGAVAGLADEVLTGAVACGVDWQTICEGAIEDLEDAHNAYKAEILSMRKVYECNTASVVAEIQQEWAENTKQVSAKYEGLIDEMKVLHTASLKVLVEKTTTPATCDAETQAGTSVISGGSSCERSVQVGTSIISLCCVVDGAAKSFVCDSRLNADAALFQPHVVKNTFGKSTADKEKKAVAEEMRTVAKVKNTFEKSTAEKEKNAVAEEKRTVAKDTIEKSTAEKEKKTVAEERNCAAEIAVPKLFSVKRFRIELKACISERIASRLPWPKGVVGNRLDDIVLGTTILFDDDRVAGPYATGVVQEIIRPGHRYERCVVSISSASIVPGQVVTVSSNSIRAVHASCLHLVRRPPVQ